MLDMRVLPLRRLAMTCFHLVTFHVASAATFTSLMKYHGVPATPPTTKQHQCQLYINILTPNSSHTQSMMSYNILNEFFWEFQSKIPLWACCHHPTSLWNSGIHFYCRKVNCERDISAFGIIPAYQFA